MPWRQPVPIRKRFRSHRLAARMERHVDHGGDREHALFRKPRHFILPPVL
jgi:hypothetical protein